MTGKILIYSLLCANLMILGACGVKPSHVEPPQGAAHDNFPATYPDPSTDPKPASEQKHNYQKN